MEGSKARQNKFINEFGAFNEVTLLSIQQGAE
jgi:hypothetical protein